MNVEKTLKNLKLRGFKASFFENKEAAADYLLSQVRDTTVGIGGCLTADQMGLYEKLCEAGNDVAWHWKTPGWETLEKANASKVFIASANAIAETGEILNIDGRGNRLSGLVFGKKRVYIIAGTNKICPDFESALFRARNTAAVQNCRRFPTKTPCKLDDKCHDCRTPDRSCRALMVLWGPMMDMESVEVILIDEELGM